jgi:hypothetical protein
VSLSSEEAGRRVRPGLHQRAAAVGHAYPGGSADGAPRHRSGRRYRPDPATARRGLRSWASAPWRPPVLRRARRADLYLRLWGLRRVSPCRAGR